MAGYDNYARVYERATKLASDLEGLGNRLVGT